MEIENGAVHGKRIRFHCLRKFLIDRLSAYASESQWKQIVGKSIDEGAYVSQDQLKGVFTRAMKDLINGNGIKAKKLMELENALVDSQKRLTNVETTNEVLRKEVNKVTVKNEELGEKVNSLQEQVDGIASSLQKQNQIKIKKQQVESEELEAKEHAEIRDNDNLSGQEEKAPMHLRYASKETYMSKKEKKQ